MSELLKDLARVVISRALAVYEVIAEIAALDKYL